MVTGIAFRLLQPPAPARPGHWFLGDDAYPLQYYAWKTDEILDMELVDVQGGYFGDGRDDPHRSERWEIDDVPHKSEHGFYFTTFNHFIDIRKGPGHFDDFDGYSYRSGSGSKYEYQKASDAAESHAKSTWQDILVLVCLDYLDLLGVNVTVDEAINWWYNDEYVHAPGQPWYKTSCSPAVVRYSFFQDKGTYGSVEQESKARFPLASADGQDGQGIPYSVFLPVDNLARYWFEQYRQKGMSKLLGYVTHAIQDASVPHHSAGCLGNWHSEYESQLAARIVDWWSSDQSFEEEVVALFQDWVANGNDAPPSFNIDNWSLKPKDTWPVESLVTWMALNAYRSYANTYGHFHDGFDFNEANARALTIKATAACMLALKQANDLGDFQGRMPGGGPVRVPSRRRSPPPWRPP
jgi:hypothetical protein